MPFPVARLQMEWAFAPSCPITGPGAPTVLICGGPASCQGDAVAGAVPAGQYSGTVTVGSPTVLVQNKPVTRVTSATMGVLTPPSGPPVPSTPGVIGATNPATVLVP